MPDTTPPTIVITSNKTALKAGEVAQITFTLSEVATDFVLSDITFTGGTLSNFYGSGMVYFVTFIPSKSSNLTGSVSVGNSKFSDSSGNTNQDGFDNNNFVSLTIDTANPNVSISAPSRYLSVTQTSVISFTLSEASTDFDISDISVTGGTLSSFKGSGVYYSAVFRSNTNNDGVISIASGLFSDAAGNTNKNLSSFTLVPYDELNANVVLTLSITDPLNYRIERATDLTTDLDGSIFICGIANAYIKPNELNPYTDAFISKYKPDGTLAWTQILGNNSSDEAYAVTTALDGSVYVSGKTNGALDGQTSNSNGSSDAFITKYNTYGTKVWTRLMGLSFGSGEYLSTNPDGSITVIGFGAQGIGSENNWFASKYSPDGTRTWTRVLEKRYGYGSFDTVTHVTSSPDGSFYLCGSKFLTKYNQDGIKAWSSELGAFTFSDVQTTTYDLATASDGSVYVSGKSKNLDGQPQGGGVDGFIMKFNQDGTKLWTRFISTKQLDIATTLATELDGSLYVSGFTGVAYQSGNSFITKYNSDGTKEWTRLLYDVLGEVTDADLSTGTDGNLYILYPGSIMRLTTPVTQTLVDIIPPTVAVTANTNKLSSDESATVNFALSEISTNFTSSDVTVTGGTLSNFTGSGTSYTAMFSLVGSAVTGTVKVANGVFTDAAGNKNADGSDANNSVNFLRIPTITNETHTLSVIVDKNVLGADAVLLKGLKESMTFTNGAMTKHVIEYSGLTFDYNQIDSLIMTVTRDGEFTEEFTTEINDYLKTELNISYIAAVAIVGAASIDAVVLNVAGADGNFTG